MMNIPFVPNQADNVHCLEAAIEMVLRYFWPTRQFTLDQIEQITQKVPGKWSAPPAAMLWLAEHEFEIVEIAGFDNRRFVSDGASYLREEFGEAFARAQEAQGDLDREQSILGQVLERIQSEVRNPTTNDIANFLAEGYVTICHVNSSIVNSTPGYVGHSSYPSCSRAAMCPTPHKIRLQLFDREPHLPLLVLLARVSRLKRLGIALSKRRRTCRHSGGAAGLTAYR
jgi:hypothetical protein